MHFKMHKIIFFPENLIFLGFTRKFRKGRVTLNTWVYLFGLRRKYELVKLLGDGTFVARIHEAMKVV